MEETRPGKREGPDHVGFIVTWDLYNLIYVSNNLHF
jgi:hypothetical protein